MSEDVLVITEGLADASGEGWASHIGDAIFLADAMAGEITDAAYNSEGDMRPGVDPFHVALAQEWMRLRMVDPRRCDYRPKPERSDSLIQRLTDSERALAVSESTDAPESPGMTQ